MQGGQHEHNGQIHRTISRRTVVAAAAAGTVALASAPASAQRCPPAPPRTKGPPVWMDLDQQERDEAYDQSVYAFNQRFVQERRDERNALMAKVLGKPERVAYGPAEIEKVDIYKTKRPNAPTMIFLHGGAWRGGRSAQGAYHAEPFRQGRRALHQCRIQQRAGNQRRPDGRWSISAGAR